MNKRRVTMMVCVEVEVNDNSVDIDNMTLEMDYSRCFPMVKGETVGKVVAHVTDGVMGDS